MTEKIVWRNFQALPMEDYLEHDRQMHEKYPGYKNDFAKSLKGFEAVLISDYTVKEGEIPEYRAWSFVGTYAWAQLLADSLNTTEVSWDMEEINP